MGVAIEGDYFGVLGFWRCSGSLGSSQLSQQEVECDRYLSHGGRILVTPVVTGQEETLRRDEGELAGKRTREGGSSGVGGKERRHLRAGWGSYLWSH